MAPRNTQIVTMMTCAKWVVQNIGTPNRAFIGQVGTGEGKSLIIAMLALYFVKRMNKKVHILENNSSLLEKDYATFAQFFSEQNVTATKYFKNSDAHITYTLRCDPEGKKDMESCCCDSAFTGKLPCLLNIWYSTMK